jgi:hypothetical protein
VPIAGYSAKELGYIQDFHCFCCIIHLFKKWSSRDNLI